VVKTQAPVEPEKPAEPETPEETVEQKEVFEHLDPQPEEPQQETTPDLGTKVESLLQLRPGEGKYNPVENEVDYETPAFLRYPSGEKQ
jgi:hypothetical protein